MEAENINQDPPRPRTTSPGSDSHVRLDTSDPEFISSLPEPLRGFARLAFPTDDDASADADVAASGGNANDGANKGVKQDDEVKEATAARLDQLEINLRSHLLQLVENIISCSEGTAELEDSLEALLVFARDVTLLCLHVVNYVAGTQRGSNDNGGSIEKKAPKSYQDLPSSFKKLPCLLLEDAFTSLPLTHVQMLWSGPPPKSSKAASNGKLPDGNKRNGINNSNNTKNLCISRYLLSYLTKPQIFTQGSKFCFLRICNTLLKQLSNRDVDSEFAGSIMMALARVFPISERSAVNVLGSFNVENATVFEGKEDFEKGWHVRHSKEKRGESDGGAESGKGSNAMVPCLGYEFYSTFWGLQKVFTDPQGTILPSRGKLSNTEAFVQFTSFANDVRTVLAALESTPTTSSSKTKNMSSHDSPDSVSDITDIHHHKYLTSSQLLHLQLRDSDIRIHFLTQLTIILSYLSSPSATLPTPETPDPTASEEKAKPNASSAATKQIMELEKRTQQLLRQTPPSGESHWKTLQWILKERESIWRNWKKNKCMPPMDRPGDNNKDGIERMRKVLSGMKRKSPDSYVTGNGAFIKSNHTIGIESDLPKITAQMTGSIPSLSDFLNPYTEALDPENGIEDTYHPRNDKVYCWKALRMLARDQTGNGQLRRFGKLRRRDGDFENLVRKIWSEEKEVEIPGNMAEEEHYDPSDTEDESEKKVEGTEDAEMDEPSVGSPVEDDDDGDDGEVLDETLEKERAAAAEEKKKEFAKALMDLDEMSGASMELENAKLAAGSDGNKQVDNGVDVSHCATSHERENKSESNTHKSDVNSVEKKDDLSQKESPATKEDEKTSELNVNKSNINSSEKKDDKTPIGLAATKDDDKEKEKKHDQTASVKADANEPKEPSSNPANPKSDDQHAGKSATASSSIKPSSAEASGKNVSSSSNPPSSEDTQVGKDEKTSVPMASDSRRSTTRPAANTDEKTSTATKPIDAKGSAISSAPIPPAKDNKNKPLDTNGTTTQSAKNDTDPSTQTQGKSKSSAKFEPPPKAPQQSQGPSQAQQQTHRKSDSLPKEEPSKSKADSASNTRGGGGARSSSRGGSGGSGGGNDGRPSHGSRDNNANRSGGGGRGDGDQGNRSGGGGRGDGDLGNRSGGGGGGGGKVNGDRDFHGHRGGGGGIGSGGGRGDRRGNDDHRRGQPNNPHNTNRGGQTNVTKSNNANDGGGGGGGGGRRGKRSHSPDHKGGGDRVDARVVLSNRGGREWGSHQNRGGRGSGGGHNRRDDRGSNTRRGRR